MIEIGRPFITKEGNFAYLKAPVKISPDTSAKYLEKTGKLGNCSWLTKTDYPPGVWEDENGVFTSVSSRNMRTISARREAMPLSWPFFGMPCSPAQRYALKRRFQKKCMRA